MVGDERRSLQCLHLIASDLIGSAHAGHFLNSGGSTCFFGLRNNHRKILIKIKMAIREIINSCIEGLRSFVRICAGRVIIIKKKDKHESSADSAES